MEYPQRNRDCWNGAECRYLNHCHFFHPPEHYQQREHMNRHLGYGQMYYNQFNMQYNQQGNLYQTYRLNQQNSNYSNGNVWFNRQPFNSTSGNPYRISYNQIPNTTIYPPLNSSSSTNNRNQQQIQSNRSQNTNRSVSFFQQIMIQMIEMRRRLPNRSRLPNRNSESSSDNFYLTNKQKEQNYKWFFNKNKTYQIHELDKNQLEKCDQCSICFDKFIPQQLDQQKQDFEEVPEKIDQNKYNQILLQDQCNEKKEKSQLEEQKLNMEQTLKEITQQTERINSQQKIIEEEKVDQNNKLVVELFCKHMYHKECIQKWFKNNSQCAVCRKDFREHIDYEKWDKDYKKRIKKQMPYFYRFERIPLSNNAQIERIPVSGNDQRSISDQSFEYNSGGDESERDQNQREQDQINENQGLNSQLLNNLQQQEQQDSLEAYSHIRYSEY